MKRIIDGKRYDTETATAIASSAHGYGGDHDKYDETLYRTLRGNWFLAGSGGPRSRWAQTVSQNCWSGGSGLIPMTADEAREWLEQTQNTDALEQFFSTDIEDA